MLHVIDTCYSNFLLHTLAKVGTLHEQVIVWEVWVIIV